MRNYSQPMKEVFIFNIIKKSLKILQLYIMWEIDDIEMLYKICKQGSKMSYRGIGILK